MNVLVSYNLATCDHWYPLSKRSAYFAYNNGAVKAPEMHHIACPPDDLPTKPHYNSGLLLLIVDLVEYIVTIVCLIATISHFSSEEKTLYLAKLSATFIASKSSIQQFIVQ